MRPERRRFFLAAMLALIVFGCGRQTSGGPARPVFATSVVVQNQSTSEMRIYALAFGRRVRLGNVVGNHTQTLAIPQALVSGGRELRFEADPLAGSGVGTSFNMFVSPGDTVTIRIPSQLR